MKFKAVLLAVGIVVLGLVARFALQAGPMVADYMDPVTVIAGKQNYDLHCAGCHGANLEGEPNWRQRDADGYLPAPPHDPSGHTWHHPDEQLFQITKFGTEALVGNGYRSRMPGFEDILDDQEIREILAYIKSTWPKPIIEKHNLRNKQAAQD